MHARFAGRCKRCGEAFAAGAPIFYSKASGARHEACVPPKASPRRAPKLAQQEGPSRLQSSALCITETGGPVSIYRPASYEAQAMLLRTDPVGGLSEWSTGGLGFDRARANLAAGIATPEAHEAFDRMRGAIEAQVSARVSARASSAKRVRVFGEEGAELDLARLMAGDSDHWARRVRVAKRRTFRLGLNIQLPAGEAPSAFQRMAAAICAAVDSLERRGYGCEITPLMFCEELATQRLGIFRPAKEAHERLDVERILSWGSPFALRGLGFALMDSSVSLGIPWTVGYGFPRHPAPDVLARVGVDYCFSTAWTESGLEECADGFVSALFGGVVRQMEAS
jgi:hypothetical protein